MAKKMVFALACLALSGFAAKADVQLSHRILRTGEVVATSPEKQTFLKNGARRVEAWSFKGDRYEEEIFLHLYDKQQKITMSPVLKIYKVVPFAKNTADKTKKTTFISSVKELDEEEILGFKTRHYLVDFKDLKANRAGKGEFWIMKADSSQLLPEIRADINGLESFDGDVATFQKILEGVSVRQNWYQKTRGDKESETEELTAFSQTKLDDSLFEIPRDFKLVTEAQYQTAQDDWLKTRYPLG